MQDHLQQSQLDSQAIQSAPQMSQFAQQSQAILVTETNPNKVIWEIELTLRNLEESADGTLRRIGPSLMNDHGISRVKFIMRGLINQNTILSHLEEKVIGKISQKVADDITDDLTLNWREYEITDKVNLDHIVNTIAFSVYFALMRAKGQNEKNWLKGITVENIGGRSSLPAKNNGGFWEKFKL